MAKYGFATEGMFSFLTKEVSYGAAVVINSTNFFSLRGAKIKVEWPDDVKDDGDMVTGHEFPTTQEILQAQTRITITEDKAHPAFVAAAMAIAAGSNTPAQDGVLTAFRHKAVPIAYGSAMPTINGVVKIGGGQYLYKGLFAESVKISAKKGDYLSCELVLRGNGSRTTDATSFVAWPAESWFKSRNIRAWKESGANISISPTPVQGAEDISSATPAALAPRLESFDFSWANNPELQLDNLGVDMGRRAASLKYSLLYDDTTEIGHYANQDNLALEFDLDSGTIIAATGAFKYGIDLIVPCCSLKAAPIPDGGETKILKADYDVTIKDDGTNPIFEFYTYTSIAAFIA